MQNFAKKPRKTPKFETKNAILGYFWPRIPYLGIFGEELKKTIVRFEISTLEFVLLQNIVK